MSGLLRAWVLRAGLVLAGSAAGCSADSPGDAPVEDGAPAPEGSGRTTIRVVAEGGQTGGEGGCADVGKPTLDFSADDVQALVAGPHQTTLAYRPFLQRPQAADAGSTAELARAVTVSVRFLGEPQSAIVCGGAQLRQDVEVTLAFEQPALDLIIEGRLIAFSAEFAWLAEEVHLEPAVVEALQLPCVERPTGASALSIGFTPRGPQAVYTACGGTVVIPSDTPCEGPTQPELDLDRPVHGVRPGDVLQTALQELSALGPLPVQWDDGASTTLSVRVEDEPRHVCGTPRTVIGVPLGAYQTAPMRVHVTTGDGRVDLSLPVTLAWTVLPDNPDYYETSGWDGGWGLSTESNFATAALREAGAFPGLALPDDRIRVDFFLMGGARPDWALKILHWEPGVTSGDPRTVASARNPDSSP
jgi:hypothetical protein